MIVQSFAVQLSAPFSKPGLRSVFEKYRGRLSPLLTTDNWRRAFNSIGFDNVKIYSEKIDGQYEADYALVVAGREAEDAISAQQILAKGG